MSLAMLLACEPGSYPIACGISAEDRAVLERVKAREAGRLELQLNPARRIQGNNFTTLDSGIFDTYTRLATIEFTNDSEFDVSNIVGHVTLTTKDGRELGTVPFKAEGYVYAGQKAQLEVKSGELKGKGEQVRVRVELVHIWG